MNVNSSPYTIQSTGRGSPLSSDFPPPLRTKSFSSSLITIKLGLLGVGLVLLSRFTVYIMENR